MTSPKVVITLDNDILEPLVKRIVEVAVREAATALKQQLPADSLRTTRLLLTHEEAARTLSVSERSLSAYVEAGDLTQVRLGPRTVRYSMDDLRALIQKNKSQITNQTESIYGEHSP